MNYRKQFAQAYQKDDGRYGYWTDDGMKVTLEAGKEGVTEAWIALVKKGHRAERSCMRRGEGRMLSLDGFSEAARESSFVFADWTGDPERRMIELEARQALGSRLRALTDSQRALVRSRLNGESLKEIAARSGCSYQAVQNRLARIRTHISGAV